MKKKTKRTLQSLIFIILIITGALIGNYFWSPSKNRIPPSEQTEATSSQTKSTIVTSDKNVTVHYIDVGQADSILIRQGDASMLIDAGTNDAGPAVVEYLKQQQISKLDYVIGTHAHEDHIGGLDDVISTFDCDVVVFPKQTASTKTFENFAKAMKAKEKQITEPQVGKTYMLGEAKFEIMAPKNTQYESANDFSIVVKVTYQNNSFLFTGDAEGLSEQEMLEQKLALKSDVLKVGHHGSKSSTSKAFLDKVSPSAAVISVGKGNDYHHPTKTVMMRLKDANISVYRTDEQGTIIATGDGNNIVFNKSPGSYTYAK